MNQGIACQRVCNKDTMGEDYPPKYVGTWWCVQTDAFVWWFGHRDHWRWGPGDGETGGGGGGCSFAPEKGTGGGGGAKGPLHKDSRWAPYTRPPLLEGFFT